MKNLKTSKKFLAIFGIILILFTLATTVAIASMEAVTKNFTDFYEKPYQTAAHAAEMRRAIQSVAKNIGYATMSKKRSDAEKYIAAAQQELEALKSSTAFLEQNFTGDKALVSAFKTTMEQSAKAKERVFSNLSADNNETAVSVFFNEYQPALLQGMEQALAISDASQQAAAQLYAQAGASARGTLIVVIALVVFTFVCTVLLAMYLTKSLTRPVRELEQVAHALAAGKLDTCAAYTAKDELGSLAQSNRELIETLNDIIHDMQRGLGEVAHGNFDIAPTAHFVGDFIPLRDSLASIIGSLSGTLGQIGQAAEQVSAGAEQVSGGAQALSQGATEQASSVEELSATIAEISQQITSTSHSAQDASRQMDAVGAEASESNRRMQDMLVAMSDINTSASEIAKIIKTIEDIAFQTNILALNAAVEAARAGVAGKGFAVVAGEVRSLAGKSAEAAKNTTALIERSLKAVKNGAQIADATAQSLHTVVEGVHDAAQTIVAISAAAREQADAVAQVTAGVDQISAVVQTNSATAEQSAAASEELSGQAAMLKALLSQFRLSKR